MLPMNMAFSFCVPNPSLGTGQMPPAAGLWVKRSYVCHPGTPAEDIMALSPLEGRVRVGRVRLRGCPAPGSISDSDKTEMLKR